MRVHLPTAAVLFLLAGAAQVQPVGGPVPQNGWLGWTIGRPGDARLVRLDANGEVVAQAKGQDVGNWTGSLALSRDGKTVFSAGQNLAALDSTTLRARWVRPGDHPNVGPNTALAVSPDGRWLAVSDKSSGDTALLDAEKGTPLRVLKHPGPPLRGEAAWHVWYRAVTALAFSPGGQTLATGSRGGGVRLRDLTSGREERLIFTVPRLCPGTTIPRDTAHTGSVHTLRWLDDHTLLTAANDGTVRRWNTRTRTLTACLVSPHGPQTVYDLPGGTFAVVAGPSVHLLEGRTFRFTASLGPHAGWVQTVRTFGGRLHTTDSASARTWNPVGGSQETVTGTDLAATREDDLDVRVRADMRVQITRAGKTFDLIPLAIPARNAENGLTSWKAELSGDLLRVTATSNIRILTNLTRDFANVYTWNLNTRRLVSCRSTEDIEGQLAENEPDSACHAP